MSRYSLRFLAGVEPCSAEQSRPPPLCRPRSSPSHLVLPHRNPPGPATHRRLSLRFQALLWLRLASFSWLAYQTVQADGRPPGQAPDGAARRIHLPRRGPFRLQRRGEHTHLLAISPASFPCYNSLVPSPPLSPVLALRGAMQRRGERPAAQVGWLGTRQALGLRFWQRMLEKHGDTGC